MFKFPLWRSMFIEVHVLCSGLHSGSPCSLRYMFIRVHVHWGPCSVSRSPLWRFMFIKVHVLYSGLHSGGACSLRYMFCIQVPTLEVHVHWGTCSVFRFPLWRSMFIKLHVLCSGSHSGGLCSLSYMFCVQVPTLKVHTHWATIDTNLFNHTDWWTTELPKYWCPIYHHCNLPLNGFKNLSWVWVWILHHIRPRVIGSLNCFVNLIRIHYQLFL